MDFFRICLMFFQRGLYMITKLNNRELFQFCEQFSIILRSGMSAIEGLAILNDDSQTERGKEILTFLPVSEFFLTFYPFISPLDHFANIHKSLFFIIVI